MGTPEHLTCPLRNLYVDLTIHREHLMPTDPALEALYIQVKNTGWRHTAYHTPFPVHCSVSGSNCCFLTHIQVSQEIGEMFWHSHLFKNFPQFVVTHTVKGFSVVNKVEIYIFLEFPCFLYDATNVGSLIPGSSVFYFQVIVGLHL